MSKARKAARKRKTRKCRTRFPGMWWLILVGILLFPVALLLARQPGRDSEIIVSPMADLPVGPPLSGIDSYIYNAEDPSDYFWFEAETDQRELVITLTNIPEGCDFDLYLYQKEENQYKRIRHSIRWGNADEYLEFWPETGRKYWVRVIPYKGFSSTQKYHLEIWYKH